MLMQLYICLEICFSSRFITIVLWPRMSHLVPLVSPCISHVRGLLPFSEFWDISFLFFSSLQFSCSVMSDSLWPYELQHTRPPCPSQTSGVYSNSCPSHRWCQPAISSSVVPFSSCPQSLPASGSFPMSQLFTWGGQSIGVSASASVLPKNTKDWSPSGWTGWISLQSKGLSRVFPTPQFKNINSSRSAFFTIQLSHPYMTTGKIIVLTRQTLLAK